MEIYRQSGTVSVTGISELNSENARAFRAAIGVAISPDFQVIEIDLSQMEFIDGTGMGALVSLYKMAHDYDRLNGVVIRLKDLQPPVLQMIELARLHHLFEIVTSDAECASTLGHR